MNEKKTGYHHKNHHRPREMDIYLRVFFRGLPIGPLRTKEN